MLGLNGFAQPAAPGAFGQSPRIKNLVWLFSGLFPVYAPLDPEDRSWRTSARISYLRKSPDLRVSTRLLIALYRVYTVAHPFDRYREIVLGDTEFVSGPANSIYLCAWLTKSCAPGG